MHAISPEPYFDIFSWIVCIFAEKFNIFPGEIVRRSKPWWNFLDSLRRNSNLLNNDWQWWQCWLWSKDSWILSSSLHVSISTDGRSDVAIKVIIRMNSNKIPTKFYWIYSIFFYLSFCWSNSWMVIFTHHDTGSFSYFSISLTVIFISFLVVSFSSEFRWSWNRKKI